MRLLLALAAPAHAAEYDPYKIPRAQFSREIAVVALQPAQLPMDIPRRDEVARRFEDLAVRTLESKGYRVIAPSVFEEQWVAMSKKVGGVYDPVTGEAVEDKMKAVREFTGRELKRTHGVSAFLVLRLTYSAMYPWSEGLGYWKANDEVLTWNGESLGNSLYAVPQRVIGLYLNVLIVDLAGELLYGIRAPVQWTRIYMARSYHDRPREQLFADPGRESNAFDVTFESLVEVGAKAD